MSTAAGALPSMWVARYVLRANTALGGKAVGREREGALLRIETAVGPGFADIHPWTELGDLSLSRQIEALSIGKATKLGLRSMALAHLDAEARSRGESAFRGLVVPESHHLVGDLQMLTSQELRRIWALGFRTLKIKMGRALASEIQCLRALESELVSFRLRIDVNAILSEAGVRSLLGALSESLNNAIEFIEDPMPWDRPTWLRLREELGVQFALDRTDRMDRTDQTDRTDRTDEADLFDELKLEKTQGRSLGFDWLICKPAIQEPQVVAECARSQGLKLCVTSYLDHPVGQMGAALEAARLVQQGFSLGTCGLASHQVYESNEFIKEMAMIGPTVRPPSGAGIGWGELLERQAWVRI